jgi:mannose-1-phosphate guanylyltransferase
MTDPSRAALRALVLTAGLGTRLDPLTRLVAKPAVPLGGRTLIARVLDWLAREQVRDVVLNLHARPETITADVGDGARWSMRLRYSWEQPQVLGSAGGPRHALPVLELASPGDSFLIVNGDTLCEIDLAPMIAAHRAHGAAVTMAVVPNPAPEHYNGIAADATGRVTGFVPKGRAHDTWHYVGIQLARGDVFAPLADNTPLETVAGIYRDRVASGPGDIFVWPVQSMFIDVGTPRDYLDAALRWADPATTSTIEPGATVDPTAHLRHALVWAGAEVCPRANLDRCIVTTGVVVPAGFAATDSILMPASVIRDGERTPVRDGMAIFPQA